MILKEEFLVTPFDHNYTFIGKNERGLALLAIL
jgi:hypothetical protein